jgi:hypothetical protein
VLTAIPAVVFVLPDVLGGHLLMAGDNVQQNYPLHVLVGSMLSHGQLPFWNQYIFSGTPLLAGFNAGAFYPLIGLFVILPDRIAWIATEVVLFSVIAIGMYVFLRALKLSIMACFLAAITFTWAGTVFSQVNHLDMTEGFAAIPWMLLAVHHIVRDGRWRWAIVLGIGFATVILGGAPEAMLDEALLVLAYAVVSAGFDRARWWRVLTRAGTGAALALSLAAVQWLPGLSAIANSQRSGFGSGFASAGSYPPFDTVFSVVPYLFGGYNNLGLQSFFASYNLPELGIYLGILPLVALVTLLHPRWPSLLARPERVRWYLVGLFGLLLALGGNTPLEHLFNVLPLYGHQRLQSRNMITVSTAVCVLFAGWIDRTGEPRDALVRFDRVMAAVPVAVVAGVLGWALIGPTSLLQRFAQDRSPSASNIHTTREASLIALVVCLVAALIIWLRARLPARWWMGAVAVFVGLDVGLVALTGQLDVPPSNAVLNAQTPVEQFVAAHLAPGGRFDVYDPQAYGGAHFLAGIPDLNILAKLPSVAGYASIVNGNYSTLTNTHTLGELNIQQLGSGALDGLDLQELVTVPEYFLVPIDAIPGRLAEVQQVGEGHGIDPVLPFGNGPDFNDQAYPFYPAPRGALGPGQSASWYFGESLSPSRPTLLFTKPSSAAVLRFGAVDADGTVDWGPAVETAAGSTRVSGPIPRGPTSGVAVQVIFGRVPSFQGAVQIGSRAFELDGALSSALRPATWHQQGAVEGYVVFERDQPPTPIYAVTAGNRGSPPVQVLSNAIKVETVRVHATVPTTIVRDVAWDPGWRGTVTVNGGPTRMVTVEHHGLVQQIVVPPGDAIVSFSYTPPHLLVASVLSLGGVGVLLLALVVVLVRRRGRLGRAAQQNG